MKILRIILILTLLMTATYSCTADEIIEEPKATTPVDIQATGDDDAGTDTDNERDDD